MPAPAAGARIEPMTGAHAAAVLAIYQAGIEEGNATFETRAPGWPAFTEARLPGHRFVAVAAGQVTGWVAASAHHRPLARRHAHRAPQPGPMTTPRETSRGQRPGTGREVSGPVPGAVRGARRGG